MEGVRKTLTGISNQAIDLIMNSWSKNTKKVYHTYINEWENFCNKKGIPLEMAITNTYLAIEFLTYLFRVRNLGYSAINNARSALSTIIVTGNNETFGKHPLVSRLMKGMFWERPSLSRYTVTYDASIVLRHLRTITLDAISLKQLSYKIVTLLCFLTGQRDQSINEIDIDFMYKDDKQLVFYIPTVLKTTTPRHHLKPLTLLRFTEEPLCVVTHIERYLHITEKTRSTRKLIISTVPPHGSVATSTVSRWVRETLKEAGINTTTFTSHSTRSSSTSTAKVRGLSIEEIRTAAGWTNDSIFAKYYDKAVINNFGNILLNNLEK